MKFYKHYITYFSTEKKYKYGYKNAPNVSYIDENKRVYYNPNSVLTSFTGTILYSNGTDFKKTTEILPTSDGYTPIGIQIVQDGFFGDGEKARYMSLKAMSVSTPDTGSTSFSSICWGGYGQDISGVLANYTSTLNGTDVPYYTNDGLYWSNNTYTVDETKYEYIGEYEPYGLFTSTSTSNYISLYDADGAWNVNPYVYKAGVKGTQGQMSGGALSDIDGKGNTKKILTKYTSEDYTTTITNSSGSGYFPAAGVCWRYHTKGTSQGDWYLGAAGEMVFITANAGKINSILYQLSQAGYTGILGSLPSYYWWSSTSYSSDYAWRVYYNATGGSTDVYNCGRYISRYVVALLQA